MPTSARTEESIFAEALDKRSPDELAAFLDGVCASDAALRARVENLLKSHEHAGSFLRKPLAATVDEPLTERPGTVIGPYKLKEQIGEGGMGLVFVAEQEVPVRRKVALKIIKPGMDSKQVIARFEAERQALAMMDHQNIAKVFDAGTTESGRPYFVMELVHGVPITEYCDANKLTPRQRLELFVPICQAIQHAHQKGIIHRDIKPSNVLVTMYDDKPVPKVIDFGVAKAIEQRLTEKSIYTQFGTLVGTFEYMSPEQAEMNAFGVDTRSDIYALGVLLYELLTGTTPLEKGRLREAAFDEIRRIIKEEEPQRPSVRLSTSDSLAKVAEARKTDPAKLSRLMRGELDWVVMRCLEKDRSRRYDNASALARDVERYLKDEPVEARPPSAWYRLRKATWRHRTALSVAGVVAAVVVLGAAATLWQASVARENRALAEKAEQDRIDAEVIAAAELQKQKEEQLAERRQEKLDRAIEAAFGSDLKKAHNAILAAEAAGVAPDRVHWLHGLVHFQQGRLEDAIKEFESSIDLKPSVAACAMHGQALFDASLYSGNGLVRYFQERKRDLLRSLKPETAEDYLFRGLTMGRFTETRVYEKGDFKSGQALDDIDKAIDMRPTEIARAFRPQVEWEIGARAGKPDPALVERALADIREAKRRLPDNKFLRLASLHVHVGAAGWYKETNQSEKRTAALLEEAGEDAKELEGITNCSYVMARVGYLELMDDYKAALKELEKASRLPETSDLVAQYALLLYEQGQDAEALRVLDAGLKVKPDNGSGLMLRIMLWAEDREVGPKEAYKRYQALMEQRKRENKLSPFDFLPLMLLGKRKESAEYFKSFPPLGKYLAEDHSDEDDEEYIKSAGKNPIGLSFSHFFVGSARLADGDRKGAYEHFKQTVDIKLYGFMYYPYARAFVARMKRHPEWPKWIDVKK
ncbi:MAG TPA: protein kinase [Gemmataceae bacterium]|nr:protein kinase [Gemmataceae bacterium]